MGWGAASTAITLVLEGVSKMKACEKITRWACRADASVGFIATENGERSLTGDLSEY